MSEISAPQGPETALRVGGAFSGIGGFELGLSRAGYRIAWLIEEHLWRRELLKARFPGVTTYSDIRWVEKPWTDLSNIDVLAGGFPCQGTSQAGGRRGLDDPRSGLWTHFDRLIGECNPAYVIIENVSGLRYRGMEAILSDLSARRYDAQWESIPARAFGSPQRRDRVFIVAYKRENSVPAHGIRAVAHTRSLIAARQHASGQVDHAASDPAHTQRVLNPVVSSRPHLPDELLQCCPQSIFCEHSLQAFAAYCQQCYWPDHNGVLRVADGPTSKLDKTLRNHRLAAIGDSLVPQIAEYIGYRILSHQY